MLLPAYTPPMHRFLALSRRFLLLTGLYLAGAVLAMLYLRTPEDVTLFWPSAGIGYAVVVRYGLGWVAIIPAAMGLLHAFVLPVPSEFLPYSIASNTLATLAGGWYVHQRRRSLHLRTGEGLMLLGGGVILAVVSAVIGAIGLVQSGMVPVEDAGRALLLWLLGDLLGITTITPCLSLIFGRNDGRSRIPLWGSDEALLARALRVGHCAGVVPGRGLFHLAQWQPVCAGIDQPAAGACCCGRRCASRRS